MRPQGALEADAAAAGQGVPGLRAAHETRDVRVRPIVAVGVVTTAVVLASIAWLSAMPKRWAAGRAISISSAIIAERLPMRDAPTPVRLQSAPAQDYAAWRAGQLAILTTTGRDASGRPHLAIERAFERVLARGLPARPEIDAAPTAAPKEMP
jgi:hypothetical protein